MVIHTCRSCQPFLQVTPLQPMGSNPQGLCPNNLWQLDVTHYSPFEKLKYIFVTADTFAHACWTSAHAGEKTKHAISDMLQCFTILPDQIKTNNGPCFTSKPFWEFLQMWKISHIMGIPYNPRGGAIVERQDQALKLSYKNKWRRLYPSHDQLKNALFTLNILKFSKENPQLSLFQRHWTSFISYSSIRVRWRDLLMGAWRGWDPLLKVRRGFGCIFSQSEKRPIWIPARDTKYMPQQGEANNDISRESTCPEKAPYASPSGVQDDQENNPAADMNAAPHLDWGRIWWHLPPPKEHKRASKNSWVIPVTVKMTPMFWEVPSYRLLTVAPRSHIWLPTPIVSPFKSGKNTASMLINPELSKTR